MRHWVGAVVIAGLCAACGGAGTPETNTAEQGQPAAAAGSPPAAPPDAAGQPAAERSEAAARPEPPPPPPPPPPPTHKEVTLPEGTTLRLELTSALASDTSAVEDAVNAVLRQAVVVDGTTVLPAGTAFVGRVTSVERSGRVKGVAKVAYSFGTFRYDDERYEVATEPLVHQAEQTKGEDAKKIAVGAGIGAAIGAIAGGGSGAATGAAIGGAGGTGAVLATRGKEVKVAPGAEVNTRLTAPLTVRVKL